jgi:hypothetical protein
MERLERAQRTAINNSVSKQSHLSYSSALSSYLLFCNIHNLDIAPTPRTLSLYTAYESHHIDPRSVKSYLSGICNELELDYPMARENRNHPIVRRTLRGCKRMFSKAVKRKDPLELRDVCSILQQFSNSLHYDDLLFTAILTIGFTSLHRLGELVVSDDPLRRDYRRLTLRHTVARNGEHITYLLPTHKADPFFEGNKVLIPKNGVLPNVDAYGILSSYLNLRDSLHAFLPELWLRESGKSPTRRWFLDRLHEALPNCNNIAGHSLRSGGATALAIQGMPDVRIQALGRWASDTFQIYIRKHPLLLHALTQPAHL